MPPSHRFSRSFIIKSTVSTYLCEIGGRAVGLAVPDIVHVRVCEGEGPDTLARHGREALEEMAVDVGLAGPGQALSHCASEGRGKVQESSGAASGQDLKRAGDGVPSHGTRYASLTTATI